MGGFIKDGLSWPWIALMSLVLLAGIGALSAALQRLFESDGGGGGGGGGRRARDPKPDPSRKLKIPESPKVEGIPTHWPPSADL